MGGPLSVVLSNIFMVKLENEVIVPLTPKLFKRFVDDIISRRFKDRPDLIFQQLNSYHHKIKMTVEISPTKFLDTKLVYSDNGSITTEVYRKPTKLPVPWSSKVPKRYKRNTINTELHRAKRIASNFDHEIVMIKSKFKTAGFPLRFTNSLIKDFQQKCDNKEDNIIPPWQLFETPKKFIMVAPY